MKMIHKKLNYVDGDIYISCPQCKSTIPIAMYGCESTIRMEISQGRRFQNKCRECIRANNAKYREMKGDDSSKWGMHREFRKVRCSTEQEIVEKVHEINGLEMNEFREFIIKKKMDGSIRVIFDNMIYAYTTPEGDAFVWKFCGLGIAHLHPMKEEPKPPRIQAYRKGKQTWGLHREVGNAMAKFFAKRPHFHPGNWRSATDAHRTKVENDRGNKG